MKTLVSDIQRFSIHDGPGIRTTVFLKGCPLKCAWCHNPECISFEQETLFYAEKCIGCGKCAEGCYSGARVLCGKEMTPEDVLSEILADRAFYGDEGGVTVAYKTTTAPDATTGEGTDLSYYSSIEHGSFGAERRNLNIGLKGGPALANFSGDIIRFRYYVNDSNTNNDFNVGKIVNTNGLPHLYLNNIDCGIVRTDVYTEVTFSTYVVKPEGAGEKDTGNLCCDIYLNGVLVSEGVVMKSDVSNYKYRAIGCWIGSNRTWASPLLTYSTVHTYVGETLNTLEKGF
ncbi:MAG: 4Fe-4S cluster-binding domain-containing protein, partial [Clostridia bacterium]|nr:4Fe-4S cluster-binding domain-containing protein [Clostridia bacterium]